MRPHCSVPLPNPGSAAQPVRQLQKDEATHWQRLQPYVPFSRACYPAICATLHLKGQYPCRGRDGAEQFIEVKSSISTSKAFFEMSHQEVNAARRLGDKYSLYRVCGVGSMQPTLLRIVNPVQKWADQSVCGIVQALSSCTSRARCLLCSTGFCSEL